MSTLYFAVWDDAKEVARGDPIQFGTITIDVASAQSVAIAQGGAATGRKRVRVWGDVDCFVHYGANPTAANDGTAGFPVGQKNPEYFDVQVGHKLATIVKS